MGVHHLLKVHPWIQGVVRWYDSDAIGLLVEIAQDPMVFPISFHVIGFYFEDEW